MMHGKGKTKWPDGKSYEGDYKNDKKDGYGTFRFLDHTWYQGEWANGRQHGKGTLFNAEGVPRVHGIWNKGQIEKELD